MGQYYDIDTAENDVKTVYGISDLDSLECTSSTYLYGSFLLLLFIIFWKIKKKQKKKFFNKINNF